MSDDQSSHATNPRLSFKESDTKISDIYKGMFELSYLNSGDQTTHIHNTH